MQDTLQAAGGHATLQHLEQSLLAQASPDDKAAKSQARRELRAALQKLEAQDVVLIYIKDEQLWFRLTGASIAPASPSSSTAAAPASSAAAGSAASSQPKSPVSARADSDSAATSTSTSATDPQQGAATPTSTSPKRKRRQLPTPGQVQGKPVEADGKERRASAALERLTLAGGARRRRSYQLPEPPASPIKAYRVLGDQPATSNGNRSAAAALDRLTGRPASAGGHGRARRSRGQEGSDDDDEEDGASGCAVIM